MIKPKGLRDIIDDAINGERPKYKLMPKKVRPPAPKPSARRSRPPFDREKYEMPKRSFRQMKDDAERTMPKRRSIRERQKLQKLAKSQGEVVRNRRLKEKYGK